MSKNKEIYKKILFLIILTFANCLQLKKTHSSAVKSKTIFIDTKRDVKDSNNTDEDPYSTTNVDIIYYAKGICSSENCKKCVTNELCQCPNGFAQDPQKEVNTNTLSCQYKRKKQWIFFLLEILLPFGIGHFYAKRILYGLIKLVVFILILLTDFLVKRFLKSYKTKQNFNIFVIILYFCYLTWQIFDVILIGINQFKDGKGIILTTLH